MSDIIFEAVRLAVMLAALFVARYAVPWLRAQAGTAEAAELADWVQKAVLWAQQTLGDKTGAERKAAVTAFLSDLLTQHGVTITADQIDVLIESAVKQMKIAENSGITITATDDVPDGKEAAGDGSESRISAEQ